MRSRPVDASPHVRMERPSGPPHLARVTLDRPDQRNAVSSSMLAAILDLLADLAANPEVRAVVLAGEGSDFCSGTDLAELERARDGDVAKGYGRALEDLLQAIEAHPVPVIARVHGAALGAGCQIAVACDLAVASADARLGIPSARLGVVVDYESVERLTLSVGRKRAGEILYAGRVLSGVEAAAWGLVNSAVPPPELEARTSELARAVAAAAPLSVRGSKQGVRAVRARLARERSSDARLAESFETIAAAAFASGDLGEGIRAFRERREPEFRGT